VRERGIYAREKKKNTVDLAPFFVFRANASGKKNSRLALKEVGLAINYKK